jgi:hypothetical protein
VISVDLAVVPKVEEEEVVVKPVLVVLVATVLLVVAPLLVQLPAMADHLGMEGEEVVGMVAAVEALLPVGAVGAEADHHTLMPPV